MKKGFKVLWPVSLGIAFLLGYSYKQPEGHHQNSTSLPLNSFEEPNGKLALLKNTERKNIISNNEAVAIEAVKLSLESTIDALKNLVGGRHFAVDMASLVKAYGLIEKLTEEELTTALILMGAELNNPSNTQLLSMLISRLAVIDPTKTFALIDEYIKAPQAKNHAMRSAVSSWAKEDPESAYYWYIDLNNDEYTKGTFSSMGIHAIFVGLASKDVNDAFNKLSEIENTGTKIHLAAQGFSQSLNNKEEYIEFIERSEELDNLKIKYSLVRNWAQKSPLEVIEWSDTLEESKQQEKLQETIFRAWSSTAPQTAANWYIEKADESNKQSQASNIILSWGMQDPKAALNWLDEQSNFDTQSTIVQLFNRTTYSDPDFVIDNFERLNNDKDKGNTSFYIYQSLERSSPKKAAEFLSASPFKKEIIKQQRMMEKYQKERG